MSRAQGRWAPSYVQNNVYRQMQELGTELVEQKMRDKPDAERMARIEKRLNLLTKYTNTSLNNWTEDAERNMAGDGIYSEASELVSLRHRDPETKPKRHAWPNSKQNSRALSGVFTCR